MKKAVIILFAFLSGIMQANAYHFELNGIYYNFVEDTTDEVEVTYFIDYRHDDFDDTGDYSGNIVIPETIIYENKEYRVTSIGEQAFRESGIESIIIPQSITYIGGYAFNSCYALKKVEVQWETPLDLEEVEKKYPKSGDPYPDAYRLAEYIFDFRAEYFQITLIVPKDTKTLYREQYVWKNFTDIKEKETENDTSSETREIIILNGAVILEMKNGGNLICEKAPHKLVSSSPFSSPKNHI